ncbi:MAG: DEAD/DEAH box helicase family protein [Carboxydocellales bacterium]
MFHLSNPRYYLYRSWGKQEEVFNISPKPELDLDFYAKKWGFSRLEILSPKLAIANAAQLLDRINKGIDSSNTHTENLLSPSIGSSTSLQRLESNNPFAFKPGSCLTTEQLSGNYPEINSSEVSNIHRLLAGRILLWEEVMAKISNYFQGEQVPSITTPSPGSRSSPLKWPLVDILQVLYLEGLAQLMPGIGYTDKGGLICNRCGQDRNILRVMCPECGEECYQCEACISMGRSRTCTTLWGFPGINKSLELRTTQFIRAQLDFRLTQAQRDAASEVLKTVATDQTKKTAKVEYLLKDVSEQLEKRFTINKGSRVLVWAACGAGKTEVSFGAIAYTLNTGGKVLFAIPRRDVVQELEPRLKQAFPGLKIIVLYGGSEDKYAEGDLVLATTHQVIRYYQNFDLVVLDEVDAFPYKDCIMLHFALERAKKLAGKLILMTATPEEKLLAELNSPKAGMTLVTIPSRHHGFPLPCPDIVIDKKLRLPQTGALFLPIAVLELVFTSVVIDKYQLFIFVPKVDLAQRVAEYLNKALPDSRYGQKWTTIVSSELNQGIHFVHAKDPNRDQKVQAFKARKFPVLVCTSIMERGITIDGCNVIVLMANQEYVFDSGTLIQMAGRAGRTTANPEGKVWFVGNSISPAMKSAVERIKAMNNVAWSMGYITRQVVKN